MPPGNDDSRTALRQKLHRLGLRPARDVRPAPRPILPAPPQLPGEERATPHGSAFVLSERYSLDYTHGARPLSDLPRRTPAAAAALFRGAPFTPPDLTGLAFLDTETTGLHAAGSLVFLVGLGRFDDNEFVIEQYFLRQPDEEPALLAALAERLSHASGLVTFNGRSFDLPMLTSRVTLNQLDLPWTASALPHLDLLHPARRLWRGRYENCRLVTLEHELLGHARTNDDIPGWMIPEVYHAYLRTGALHDIQRVLYHNLHDVLAMVTLTAHLLDVFHDDPAMVEDGAAVLRSALWHDDHAQPAAAEAAYQSALAANLPDDDHVLALQRYAAFLKKHNRRAEAVPYWQLLTDLLPTDPKPALELAIYYEHHGHDLPAALRWTARARQSAGLLPTLWQRNDWLNKLDQRRARLQRKLALTGATADEH